MSGAGLLTAPAAAQNPRFRLTPLVKLGFTPQVEFTSGAVASFDEAHGTAGINNKGQVVYTYIVPETSPPVYHAWLWLPTTDYGYTTAGFHDLCAESSDTDDDDHGIARDINESGVVVGEAENGFPQSGVGAAWSLASGAPTYKPFPVFSTGGNWSTLHAINDASTPDVVGSGDRAFYCDCSQSIGQNVTWPFRSTMATTPTLTALALGPDSEGEALDINTVFGENSQLIAGFTDCTSNADARETGVPCNKAVNCRIPMDAVDWDPSARDELTDLGINGSKARAVNDDEQMAGWGFDEEECRRTALYWLNAAATYTVLPGFSTGNLTRANALNQLSPASVVGSDDSEAGAALWEDVTGTILVTDLRSTAAIGGCNSRWLLQEAHDINDDTWIITWGNDTYNFDAPYAILLTPFPQCPADIDQSGCVNTSDLLSVIANYGACPIGTMCIWDINGDCNVNVADLLGVIAANGCTACQECTCSSSLLGPSEPPTLEEVIAMVLASALSEELKAQIIEELIANWPQD